MRQQIERDKEMMSKKFEKLSKSKNVLLLFYLSFLTMSIDEHGPLPRARSIIHHVQLIIKIEELQAQA